MSYVEAVTLAVVQALTEFLPVSSSGHLVLSQRWFGGSGEVDLLYNVVVHLATMVAVVLYFRRDLWALARGLVGPVAASGSVFDGHEGQGLWYIALANVPTALLGLFIERFLWSTVTRPDVVGVMLIVTGAVLWCGRGRLPSRSMAEMGTRDALVVGVIQGLAVLPGISRSGTTIAGGMMLGLERELAARFSLLISIPAILGATVLEWWGTGTASARPLGPYIAAMLVAGSIGYLAIDIIMRLVRRQRFYLFALYVWPLGVMAIASDYL